MSLSQEIINKVKEKDNQEKGKLWIIVGAISPFVAGISLPLAITVGVVAYTMEAIENKENLDNQNMPDQWLKDVSESKDVSPKGLAFLSKQVSKKGFVTVNDALKFLDIEKEVENKNRENNIENNEYLDGAKSLLLRAQKECKGLINPETLNSGFLKIKKSIDLKKTIISNSYPLKKIFNNKE